MGELCCIVSCGGRSVWFPQKGVKTSSNSHIATYLNLTELWLTCSKMQAQESMNAEMSASAWSWNNCNVGIIVNWLVSDDTELGDMKDCVSALSAPLLIKMGQCDYFSLHVCSYFLLTGRWYWQQTFLWWTTEAGSSSHPQMLAQPLNSSNCPSTWLSQSRTTSSTLTTLPPSALMWVTCLSVLILGFQTFPGLPWCL